MASRDLTWYNFKFMSDLFFNRDLSWLQFNKRVLDLASDQTLPLLERIRFLSIFSSNLDEFFMKRVGYLRYKLKKGNSKTKPDGALVSDIFHQVREQILALSKEQARLYTETLIPELASKNILFLEWKSLDETEKEKMRAHFSSKIFPVLTPLAVDPSHPFPFLSNLSVSLGIKLHIPKNNKKLFARIKIPDGLPALVPLPKVEGEPVFRFIKLEEIIKNNLTELFPNMVIEQVTGFRVTRSAYVEEVEEDPEDVLDTVEEALRMRRLAEVVRLQYNTEPDPWVGSLLKTNLVLDDEDIYNTPSELHYKTLEEIAKLPFPELKFTPWVPVTSQRLLQEDQSIFDEIQKGDILVHHPFESFQTSVERFIRSAVDDPNVMAIKMTVYRTGLDSPFIPLLIEAAEKGKQVVCVVEVKARFDEERNLSWAEKLENAGVHVMYGVVGLKTHTKISLVVRKEGDEFRFYTHVGTGNYNSETARTYTDFGFFSARPEITREVVEIFNYLTGLSLKKNYKKFLVSPINMREKFLEMIENEIQNHTQGEPAAIVAKMNSLEDEEMISALYKASQAGVPITLIVRGFCCLKPGVKNLSEKIRVISIVGRFLEHSRVYYFQNKAAKPEGGLFYMGSADWMHRNLSNRVETVVSVEDKKLKKDIWTVLDLLCSSTRQTWELDANGNYKILSTKEEDTSAQEQLSKLFRPK